MRILSAVFCLSGGAIVWLAIHWVCTDKGIVRMSDYFYLFVALVGITQTTCALWGALPKHHVSKQKDS